MKIINEVVAGNLDKVKEWIASGIDINKKQKNTRSALMQAVWSNKPEIAKELLEAGANPNITDDEDRTALIYSVMDEDYDLDMIKELIKAGADVNHRDCEGRTALISAANNLNTVAIKELLKAGADPNIKDKDKLTPIMECMGEIDIIEILLKAGADPNAANKWGETPLMLADDNVDVAKLLIQAGADTKKNANKFSKEVKEFINVYNNISLFLVPGRKKLPVDNIRKLYDYVYAKSSSPSSSSSYGSKKRKRSANKVKKSKRSKRSNKRI